MEIKSFEFGVSEKKIQRTYEVIGKCVSATNYITVKGNLPGIAFEIVGVPYKLRVLCGSVKGGIRAQEFIRSTVRFTGVDREYDGKRYFSPKDCEIVQESALAGLAKAGVAFAGSLD